jgi:PPM family protein phosphatase
MLDTDEIYNIVTENKNDVKKGCELLIANANEQGGYDNISVILISYID